MDYITKDLFNEIGEKIILCVKDAYEKYTARANTLQAVFVFTINGQKMIAISHNDIIFIETSKKVRRKMILHGINCMYEFYGKLDDIHKELGG